MPQVDVGPPCIVFAIIAEESCGTFIGIKNKFPALCPIVNVVGYDVLTPVRAEASHVICKHTDFRVFLDIFWEVIYKHQEQYRRQYLALWDALGESWYLFLQSAP